MLKMFRDELEEETECFCESKTWRKNESDGLLDAMRARVGYERM